MNIPLNKSIKKNIPLDILNKINTDNLGVSIITCTNKFQYMNNIFNNYENQKHPKKELIIILNNNNLDIICWKNKAKSFNNVNIYQLDEKVTLGECLNFAVKKTKFDIIAKFDDDDYYGINYLSHSLKAFEYTGAAILGKYTTFVYFENSQTLAIRNPNRDQRYTYRVEGSTLIIKKNVFEKVKFKKLNLGEDAQFCKDCIKENFNIFSTDMFNFVYIRHKNASNHTWNVDNDYLLKSCKLIGKIENFKTIVDKY